MRKAAPDTSGAAFVLSEKDADQAALRSVAPALRRAMNAARRAPRDHGMAGTSDFAASVTD
jgi:hypothetical protein